MKKTLALLAVLCLLLTSLPVGLAVSAENVSGLNLPEDDFIIEDEGNFDDDGYVAISSLEDLEAMREDLTGNYYLTADIVIPEGTEFAPIGSMEDPFLGTFDGSGHTITGLSINVTDGTECVGLFGYNCGIIYGLGLVDCTITVEGFGYIGTIAGYNAGGTITDCYATGSVEALDAYDAYIGGIVGFNEYEGTVKDCYNVADITADAGYVGGIAGGVLEATIETCYNAGAVNAEYAFAGGVVAYVEESNITDCYYVGDVEDEYAVQLTKAEAADAASFAGFDFEGVWTMEGLSTYKYPELRAVNLEGDFEVEEEVVITGIAVTTLPKTSYTVGDALDLTGGIVTVTYSNNTTAEIALADAVVTGFDGATAGNQTLTVAYESFTATFDVVVKEKVVATVIPSIVSTGLKLTWTSVSGASAYVISRADVVDGVAGEFVEIATATSATYTDKTVVANGRYQYQVVAMKGTNVLETAVSTFVTFVAAPTSALQNTLDGIVFTWDDSNADSYLVYRAVRNDETGKYSDFELVATVTEATYTDTTAEKNVNYAYKVRAVKDGLTGPESAQKTIRYLFSPSITAVNSVSGMKLTWKECDYPTAKYNLYRSSYSNGEWTAWTKLAGLNAGTASYMDLTAKNGVLYRYKIEAYVTTSFGVEGETSICMRLTYSAVNYSQNEPTGIEISWKENTAATAYNVYRSSKVNGEWTAWGKPYLVTTDTYLLDEATENGVLYRYMIRPVNGEYISGAKEGAVLVRLDPVSMTMENVSGGVKVTWTKNSAAAKYFVYRCDYVDGAWTAWKKVGTPGKSATEFTDMTGMVAGTQYRYMVRVVQDTYQSYAPASQPIAYLGTMTVSASATSKGVNLSWKASSHATSYNVYRRVNGTTEWELIASDLTDVAYTDATAVSGTAYQYKVCSVKVTEAFGTSIGYGKASSAVTAK